MIANEGPSGGQRWPMLRVLAGSERRLKLLSVDWVRLTTHFVGHTVLCTEDEDCRVCELRAARPYWYLPVQCAQTGAWLLMEMSASASAELEQRARFAVGELVSGTIFRVSRRGKRSAFRYEVDECEGLKRELELREWFSPLMAVFGLPPMGPGEDLVSYGARVKPVVVKRCELAAAKLEASAKRGV